MTVSAWGQRWSIGARIVAIVLVLTAPLVVVGLGQVWHIAAAAREQQKASLLYTARSLAAAVDARLEKFISLAQALSRSPALLQKNLVEFEKEARRAFPSITDSWVLVADLDGQQLLNIARISGDLPRRPPEAIEAQRRAMQTRSIIVAPGRVPAPVKGRDPKIRSWVMSIEVPILRDGEPYLALAVTLHPRGFLPLLGAEEMPPGRLAGIIDQEGRFIARVPNHEQHFGQLASEGFRRTRGQEGVFEFASLENETIVQANARSSIANWTVGVSIKKSQIQAAALYPAGWALLTSGLLAALSLVLAITIGRSISRPIASLSENAGNVLSGASVSLAGAPPEIAALQAALRTAAAERDRATATAEQTRAHLADIVDFSADAIVSESLDGMVTSFNASAENLFGYKAEDFIGTAFRRLVPMEKRFEWGELRRRLVEQGRPEHFETVLRTKDDRLLDVSVATSAIRDADGRVVGISNIVRDVTERKRAEQQKTILINELNHRVKNTLATVQAIAMQTFRKSETGGDPTRAFQARLVALAAAHDILTRESWTGAALDEVVRQTVAPHGREELFEIAGPSLRLSPKQALAIAMGMHELCTNAVKYGALSKPEGRICISWEIVEAESRRLRMWWQERGGPQVEAPTHKGFGSHLIEKVIASELEAEISVNFQSTGLICSIEAELSSGSPLKAAAMADSGGYWRPQSTALS